MLPQWDGLQSPSLLLACLVLLLVSGLQASHRVCPSHHHRASEDPLLLGNHFFTSANFGSDEYIFLPGSNLPPSNLLCMGVDLLCRNQKAERRAGQVVSSSIMSGGHMKCISWLTSQKVCCTYLANKLTAPYHVGCTVVLTESVHGMI